MPEPRSCLNSPRTVLKSRLSLCIAVALFASSGETFAEEFMPMLKAHAKPKPYDVVPLYDLNQPGGVMPYVQVQADPTKGDLDRVLKAKGRKVHLGSSYNSATDGHETFADVRAKGSTFYGRAILVAESANSYDGASGKEQRFGYDRQAGQLVLGAKPRSSTNVKLIYIRDIIEDNKVPTVIPVDYDGGALKIARGFGVDPVDTDRQIAKVMWDEKLNHANFKKMHLELYSIALDRTAENFSLRDTVSAKHLMARVDRKVHGAKLKSDIAVDGTVINLGLDYTNINHDAQRYGGPTTSGIESISAYQYPGVEMDEWLLSATSEFDLAAQQTLTLALSYKYVNADATKATLSTDTPHSNTLKENEPKESNPEKSNLSALELYKTYYGDVELEQGEGHFSGKLQWDYVGSNHFNAYASMASLYRSPDTQERYFAVTSFVKDNDLPIGPNARAVGNPEIDWEQHRAIEAGAVKSSVNWQDYGRTKEQDFAWQLDMKAYYDDINDFITRDRARGQSGIQESDYARIWRNVDAVMSGVVVDAKANFTKHIASRMALNFTYGENTTDDRDLYGIAPFEANWFLDYFDHLSTGGTWNLGTQLRYVAKHDDVDTDPTTGSGFDAGETEDFTVLNLYASVQLWNRVGVKVGVNNLTDESYYDSMAKYPLDGNPYLVEAPERHFYVAVAGNF